MIYINEVNREIRFSVSKRLVEVGNMFARGRHELVNVIHTHRNDDLFA